MDERTKTNQELQEILERMNESERFGVALGLWPIWVQEEGCTTPDLIQMMLLNEKEAA